MPDLTAFQRLVLHTLDERGGASQADLRRAFRKPGHSRSEIDNALTDDLFALRLAGMADHVNRFWTITDKGRAVLAALAKAKEMQP